MLEILGVRKDYHSLRPLRVRELRLHKGERVAVVGMDAVAAQVLVDLITGASLPDDGIVRVLGRATADIDTDSAWLDSLDRLGIVTERAVLLDGLSVLQNLALPFSLSIDPMAAELRERAARLADEVGVPESAWSQPAGGVSPEIRMRVHVGRALALDPELLLLEHANAPVPADAIRRFAEDAARIAARRCLAVLALTAEAGFADAVAERTLSWQPSSGALTPRRRGWFR